MVEAKGAFISSSDAHLHDLLNPKIRYWAFASVEDGIEKYAVGVSGGPSDDTSGLDVNCTYRVRIVATDGIVARMKVDRPEVALAPGESTAITISDSFGWALVSGASWESGDPGVVSVDSTGNITAHAAGTVTVTARVTAKQIYPWSTDVSEKTREFTTRVTVADHAITGVTAPDGVTVAAGTAADALGLPDSVAVTYDNGTSGTAPVVWADLTDEDKKALASREGGAFMLSGTVNGWDKPVTVKVTVSRASVTTAALAEEDAAVTTPSGTNPTLPATATVTWSNGDTTQETITWPELTDEQKAVVAARQGGSFTITGTVEGQDVTAKVTVSPALRLAVRAAQTGQPVGASLLITAKVTVTAASTPKPTDKPTTQSTVRLVDRTRRDRRR